MLTAREHASSIFTACRSLGTTSVRRGDMAEVTKGRLALLDKAILAVESAYASERQFIGEPDDNSSML
jgi:hypothetical protein